MQCGSGTAKNLFVAQTKSPKLTCHFAEYDKILRNYFKYTILRNPLERLLSAFAHLYSHPLPPGKNPPLVLSEVFMEFRPKEYNRWITSNRSASNITITFEEFIKWYIHANVTRPHVTHITPFLKIAEPCKVRYDYYVRFKNFNNEFLELYKLSGGSPMVVHDGMVLRTTNSKLFIYEYYAMLSNELKKELYHAIREDLTFYHTLEPDDVPLNMELLGMNSL